jgi:NAD(P)-dependent dehydrogenase (short-subunit alcohol dehydrogenase family)
MKIAAITGGAGALGSSLARLLASRGYKLVLIDTKRERIDPLVAELGDAAIGCAADFTHADAWEEAMRSTTSAFGGPPSHAALVAGGFSAGAPLHASSDEVYERMMRINVDTVHRALRALLPPMVAAKRGSIVIVGSRAGERPWTSAGAAAYAASKAAAVTLAQTVAQEVLMDGVRVNAILPSIMDTPANRAAMPDVDPSSWVSLPSAAGVIAFLLSDEARDVTGAALPVYGRV